MLLVETVMTNSKIVKCGDEVILFGVPPEVVKPIQAKNMSNPTMVLIPDRIILDNNFQNSVEFVFYYYVFISNQFFNNKKKLKILGEKHHLRNNKKLLKLCLYGLDREEYKKLGLSEKLINSFIKERDYFSLKNDKKEIMEIEDLIHNYQFDLGGVIRINNDIVIKHLDVNIYKVIYKDENIIVDLNDPEKQTAPYRILEKNLNILDKFSITALGGSSGFSPTKSSAAFILCYNANYILIDAIPYLDDHFFSFGISKGQISCIFLSHIHDDHCNLVPFIFSWKKVSIITTEEIFWMAMYKIALLLDVTISQVCVYFKFIPVTVGYVLDYYGLHIRPHYAIHSIPTIGARFYTYHNKKEYSITLTADNSNLEETKKMLDKGIISKNRYKTIKNIYSERGDLLFSDAGGGAIHGSPTDVLKSKAKRVIFYNLDYLSTFFTRKFSIVSTGNNYSLIKGSKQSYITNIIYYLSYIIGKFNVHWLSSFLGNLEIVEYNKNDVIITQGDRTDGFVYLILSGYCEVSIYDNNKLKIIAVKEAGDIFGEMALFENEKKRNASIIAYSNVILSKLDGNIFRSFVYKENKLFSFSKYWGILSILCELRFFKDFSNRILQAIARESSVISYENPQEEVLSNIGILIVIDGKVSKYDKKGHFRTLLEKGNFFISKKIGSKNKIKLDIDKYLLAIVVNSKSLKRISDKYPELLFILKNRHKCHILINKDKFSY